jgi:hypothetical protein
MDEESTALDSLLRMTHGVRTYGASAFLVGWGLGTSTGESRNESDDERLHLRTKVTSSARSGTWHLLGKLRPNQIHAMSAEEEKVHRSLARQLSTK